MLATFLLAVAFTLGTPTPVQPQPTDIDAFGQADLSTTTTDAATTTAAARDLSRIGAATLDTDRLVVTLIGGDASEQLAVEDVHQIMHIVGGLTIRNSTDAAVRAVAAALVHAGNVLVEASPRLSALDFPMLKRVGGDVEVFECDSLVSLSLPVLDQVGDDFYVYDVPQLRSLSAPALTETRDNIYVGKYEYERGTHSLTELDLSGLTTVLGYAEFEDMGPITHLALPALETVGGYFDVDEHTDLISISVPKLASVGDQVEVDENSKLQALRFPMLKRVGGEFDLHQNALLSAVEAPQLGEVNGDLKLDQNPVLKLYFLPVACNVSGDVVSVHAAAAEHGTNVVVCAAATTPQPCSPGARKAQLAALQDVVDHTAAAVKLMIAGMKSVGMSTDGLERQHLALLAASHGGPGCR